MSERLRLWNDAGDVIIGDDLAQRLDQIAQVWNDRSVYPWTRTRVAQAVAMTQSPGRDLRKLASKEVRWLLEQAVRDVLDREAGATRNVRVVLTAFGETKALGEWMKDPRTRVGYALLRYRLRNGGAPELSIATPPNGNWRG